MHLHQPKGWHNSHYIFGQKHQSGEQHWLFTLRRETPPVTWWRSECVSKESLTLREQLCHSWLAVCFRCHCKSEMIPGLTEWSLRERHRLHHIYIMKLLHSFAPRTWIFQCSAACVFLLYYYIFKIVFSDRFNLIPAQVSPLFPKYVWATSVHYYACLYLHFSVDWRAGKKGIPCLWVICHHRQ